MQKLHPAIIINTYMDKAYETKKYASDKIVLFGLFVIVLLIARFIVISRSAIVLSEPIKLSHTGLSVSMPSGNGWQSEKQWRYAENAFSLSSSFASSSGMITARANCQYLLAATETAPDVQFKQRALAVGGIIAKTGRIQTGLLTIDWAHIKKQNLPLDTFFGTVRLLDKRQLDIKVHQVMADAILAERIFRLISENLKFKDNQLLEAGSEIVAEIKSKGLSSLLASGLAEMSQNGAPPYNQNRQAFFLIKDAARRTIGFTMDVLTDSGHDTRLNIQAASLLYIQGRYAREEVTSFQSDNSFARFVWKSETSGAAGSNGTELILDEDGVMTVRKFCPQPKEKIYQLSDAAIPDILLEFAFSQTFNSSREKIVVDIIKADGKITPTLISRIEPEDTAAVEKETGGALRMELLSSGGFSQLVYLDGQRWVSKRLLRRENVIFERTSIENIVRQFPEWADFILQKNKMLKQNQL